MNIANIISLPEFILKNTYFLFQCKYYEQLEGAAMDSPISSTVAKLFVESFETGTLTISTYPHICLKGMWMIHLWYRHQLTKVSVLNTSKQLIILFNSLWRDKT